MAKFSQKAQCEPWTGQDGPGGLRAKAGAGERGSACLAAFHGPVWSGDPDGDRPAPKRWPAWAMGGAGPRGACCRKKRKKRQAAAWRGDVTSG